MNLANYQAFVERSGDDNSNDLAYCIMALNEEAGEVAGWHKKFVSRKNRKGNLTQKDLAHELGDILWYLTKTAKIAGWTLEDIMVLNHTKLTKRMEDGQKAG